MYLLDTNVVSELRKAKPHGGVVEWLQGVADPDLHLSAVTIGEIQSGIEITRQNNKSKADEIEAWLEQVTETYNIHAMDAGVFRCWARLMHKKSDALIEDAMIAATAIVHGLTIVTRNEKDFASFKVALFNPFKARR